MVPPVFLPLPLPLPFVRLQPLPRRRLRPIFATISSSSSSFNYNDTSRLRKLFPRARDMKIEIGRYKGRMLGTLPSSYLKWLADQAENSEYDLDIWPGLAKVVLEDPFYQDRIEYEPALRLFVGGAKGNFIYSENFDMVKAYREIGDKNGWDWDDKDGWAKVKRDYIGTSYSWRIPRKKDKGSGKLGASESVASEWGRLDGQNVVRNGKRAGFSVGRKRGERIERMRLRREEEKMQMMKSEEVVKEVNLDGDEEEEEEEEVEGVKKVRRTKNKKERVRRVKEDLGRAKRTLGLGINDEMISFAKREEDLENGEDFNPFPGRAALFQKLKREGKID